MSFETFIAIVGGLSGLLALYLQLRDHQPRCSLHLNFGEYPTKIVQDAGGAPSLQNAPSLQVKIVNRGALTVYPLHLRLMVGKDEITHAPSKSENFASVWQEPLLPGRCMVFEFNGQFVLGKLPEKLRKKSKLSFHVVVDFEDGRKIKTWPTTIQAKSLHHQ